MPKENRKRGKKYKKKVEEAPSRNKAQDGAHGVEQNDQHKPTWIVSGPKDSEVHADTDAPFGYVDADVKAYFRTVDIQIRDWQESQDEGDHEIDGNGRNEEKRMFFVAALTEMSGNEKQLATDVNCSLILERMTYSMDDFVRRVFVDRLAGSYETLVKHRFASHVCQTLFTVAADTISRECRDVLPTMPESLQDGELLTLTQLVLNVCKELLPTFTSLIMDPYASHVVRALLLLLCPNLRLSDSSLMANRTHSNLRSKKSAAWKARQGSMRSVFGQNNVGESFTRNIPHEFRDMSRKFVQVLQDELSENEVRALAANKVASPVLQILLEVEADQDMAAIPGSLMDRVTFGIITTCQEPVSVLPEPSDYVNTLLRDPTSSHLLETVIRRAPKEAIDILWSTYLQGKLARLANHPVANFVVAKALERVTAERLGEALQELNGAWQKTIRNSRTGVLRAAIDRAATLRSHEKDVVQSAFTAFDLEVAQDPNFFLHCALRVMPLQEYKSSLLSSQADHDQSKPEETSRTDTSKDAMEPKIQGAILIQSLLRLAEPHNQIVIDSVQSLSMDELLAFAHHPTSSRILDAYLESPTVPFKAKREFVVSFIGHFHLLVDNRIGSRIGDRCWAFADPYLKEKIGRSLIPHEQFLAGSYYGKFFARNLNLYLLQRRPEEWKTMQAERKRAAQSHSPAVVARQTDGAKPEDLPESARKRKRTSHPEDEIDALFDATLGKKTKKGALGTDDTTPTARARSQDRQSIKGGRDEGLQGVLGAIRAAPKVGKKNKKK